MIPEKAEEAERRLIMQLKQRVRAHRPAAKVLEMSIALTEERLEMMEDQLEDYKRSLKLLKKLKPEELEPESKS